MPRRDTKAAETHGFAPRLATCGALAAVWLIGACAAVDEPAGLPDSVAAVPLGSTSPRSEPPRDGSASLSPEVNDDPKQVIGLDDAAIEALLGKPSFRREDSPAEVWQYKNEECVLDVFLYTDGPAKPHRAVYFEMRDEANGDPPDGAARRRCFRSLLLTSGPS